MKNLMIGRRGEIALPQELRTRYRLESNTPVRVIETQTGVILVPVTDASVSEELLKELAEWQSLGTESWNSFPYDGEEQK
jgi:bifunctional DNA-binding transcriptional regulator/antitoxin component of YhaV-PrlF toxin-antitoxin module